MGVETIYPLGPVEASWGTTNGTHLVRTQGVRSYSPENPPIINLHAQPGSEVWEANLTGASGGLLHSTYAAGYQQFAPFTGRNWGHSTNMSPSGTGGTALAAVDSALLAAGNPAKACLVAVSMGCLNALRWGWMNPSRVQGMRLLAPAWDLMHLWDSNASDFRASLNAVFGTATRAEFLTATADYDPRRNAAAIAAIDGPVNVYIAVDDGVVGVDGIEEWAEAADVHLQLASGGGHTLWAFAPEYDELDALRVFQHVPLSY